MADRQRKAAAFLAALALAGADIPAAAAPPENPPANAPPRRRQPADRRPPQQEVYFANCTEARAAGAAPLRRGDPGYAPKLDRDNDGIACER